MDQLVKEALTKARQAKGWDEIKLAYEDVLKLDSFNMEAMIMSTVGDIETATSLSQTNNSVNELTDIIRQIPDYYNEDSREGIFNALLFAIPFGLKANARCNPNSAELATALGSLIADLQMRDMNVRTLSLNVAIEKAFQSAYRTSALPDAVKPVINDLLKQYGQEEKKYYWNVLHPDEKERLDDEIKSIEEEIRGLEDRLKEMPEAKLIELTQRAINENASKKASLGLFKGKEKAAIDSKINELTIELQQQKAALEKVSIPINEEIERKNKRIEEINEVFDETRSFDIPMGSVVIDGALDRIMACYN